MSKCYHCNQNLEAFLGTNLSRQDSCSSCGKDLRVCKNCIFYDPHAHWGCKEHVSEHVIDKEKANFCDFFKLNTQTGGIGSKSKDALKEAAEALFKKK